MAPQKFTHYTVFHFPLPLSFTLQCIGISSGNNVVGINLSDSTHFPGSKRLTSNTTVSSININQLINTCIN